MSSDNDEPAIQFDHDYCVINASEPEVDCDDDHDDLGGESDDEYTGDSFDDDFGNEEYDSDDFGHEEYDSDDFGHEEYANFGFDDDFDNNDSVEYDDDDDSCDDCCLNEPSDNGYKSSESSEGDSDEPIANAIPPKRRIESSLDDFQVCVSKKMKTSHESTLPDECTTKIEISNPIEKCSNNVPIVPRLPLEVFQEIMSLLSSIERGRCKLVCKEWYNVCIQYERKEKICISNTYNNNLDNVLATLQKSTRSCFNFEFYGIDFKGKPRKIFWQTCGPRVLSIKLINCHITSPPFASILRYCSNLKEMEIYYVDMKYMRYGLSLTYPSNSLPANLRNHSLRTLKIHFRKHSTHRNTSYWMEKLNLLLHLFPNITNFSFNHHHLFEYQWFPCMEEHERECNELKEYILHDTMESIAINFVLHPGLLWNSLKDNEALTKVTEIVIAFTLDDLVLGSTEKFLEFTSRQTNLRKITCMSFLPLTENWVENLMTHLLNLRSLRHFDVVLRENDISWKDEWSKLLSKSNLENLHFVCNTFSVKSACSQYPRAARLIDFAIDVRKELDVKFLLESFPNLKKLSLSHVDVDLLEFIYANQLKLQSFKVDHTSSSLLSPNAINQLRRLNELEIPETLVLEPHQLHRLKYLYIRERIYPWDKIHFTLDRLRTFISCCPSLEVICCNSCIFTEVEFNKFKNQWKKYQYWFANTLSTMISELKNLKFLYFKWDDLNLRFRPNIKRKNMAIVFKRCPSLRVLIYRRKFVKDSFSDRLHESGRSRIELLRMFTNVDEDWICQQHQSSEFFNDEDRYDSYRGYNIC